MKHPLDVVRVGAWNSLRMQRQSLQKTLWQLALKIQKTRQQRNRRWKILKIRSSLLTRVLSKRIAVLWDTDHEALPAPAKRLKRDDDGVTRTRIALAIGVRTIPNGKDILTKGHQVPEAAMEVLLVRAPLKAVVWPNSELTVQLESVPLGTGLPWTKVQLELTHHGAGLPRTEAQLESVPSGTGLPRVRVQLEPAPHGARLPWTVQLE